MNSNSELETYLYVSPKNLLISVNNEFGKNVYKNELLLDKVYDQLNIDTVDYFLNKNIFKIEKLLNNFVRKIFIIIDFEIFFPIELSVKKNNYGDSINFENLNYLLNEAKECCKKTINEKKIIHMTIESYRVNDDNYSYFPKDQNSNSFSIQLKFMCLSDVLVRNLEMILRKYQISLGQIISAKYMKSLFVKENKDLIKMAKETINGCNANEIKFMPKTQKNGGFFEKFFHFFS